uniref:Uncharacterized protein n=1 Tax=Anguilla anguilla TaxID=7936 RepID=A0A0E9Y0R1_ANGAN
MNICIALSIHSIYTYIGSVHYVLYSIYRKHLVHFYTLYTEIKVRSKLL